MTVFSRPVQLPVGAGIKDFTCGSEVVDRWVAEYSASARRRGTAVIYASYCGEKVAGFYTLSAHSVARESVGGGWFTRNAPEQVPAVLLGMMGVSEEYKGRGLGAALLRDAILNSMKIAELAGAKALVVDPVDESARGFYEHFGFTALIGTHRMALKLQFG
ncbi:GNAT family N-acetyltransferase [Adlercreutzia sp. ZJ138]|uniref:GNAT family N-acetyltransferase n=1 Tax=Adlercreutzia sp. ZJ138 TaxID=2709405 RepID=UPI0013ED784F|nr:GNAT family N-acetyltransferase [Adlercreutzia sp. ZJ138]